MHDISKHNSEEEWESHRGEDSWVDFLILRDTVSVNDHLEGHGKLVSLNQSWSDKNAIIKFLNEIDVRTVYLSLFFYLQDLIVKLSSKILWAPKQSNENVV